MIRVSIGGFVMYNWGSYSHCVASDTCEDTCPWLGGELREDYPYHFYSNQNKLPCLMASSSKACWPPITLGLQAAPSMPWFGMKASSWPPHQIKFILHTHFYVIYLPNYQLTLFTLIKTEKCKKNTEQNYCQTKNKWRTSTRNQRLHKAKGK